MRVAARFTMKPDPNMKSIIGQTAHNLDEVRLHLGSTAQLAATEGPAAGAHRISLKARRRQIEPPMCG